MTSPRLRWFAVVCAIVWLAIALGVLPAHVDWWGNGDPNLYGG